MERKKPSDFPQKPLDLFSEYRRGDIGRRSFLDGARRFAVSGVTAGAVFEMMRPNYVWAQRGEVAHPASARLLDQLRTRFTFQISVDVSTVQQGLVVASAALAGGVNILEMGTPLLKSAGVSNVVPAFRRQFPKAILLADMKTMDGGGGEARSVYAGGRTRDWIKIKCQKRQEFVIGGYTDPQGARGHFGALHLGLYDGPAEARGRWAEAGANSACSPKRATINSYMYGDAKAIANIAFLAGQDETAARFRAKANRIKELVETRLWDDQAQFFNRFEEQYGWGLWYDF